MAENSLFLESYKEIGGVHPESASVKNILSFHGIKAPHTNNSFTEAMLFGIAGGLGATYILWEMQKHGYPSLVLGFRYKLNYSVQYLEQLMKRMGGSSKIFETTGQKKAMAQLTSVLESNNPAIAWMDLGGKPYYMHFMLLGVAVVFGLNKTHALLDKRAQKPFEITLDHLISARAKVPSFKNRVMVLKPGNGFDLEAAIRDGIDDCISYLGAKSTSFALPSIRKWARLMTDEKSKKGWPTVFKNGRGLYGSLRTVYEAIEQTGSGGGALRGMYANFLDEASGVINNSALKEIAKSYREIQAMWTQLAQISLPNEIDIFEETKNLLDKREKIILKKGSDSLKEIGSLNDRLHAIKGQLNDDFPLNSTNTMHLYAEIQTQIFKIEKEEKNTLQNLEDAMS
jgi:hypothetical protein